MGRALPLLLGLALAGCDADESADQQTKDTGVVADAASCSGTRSAVFVVAAMDFTVADENGFVKGFDLDGTVSEAGDPAGCGHGDDTAPDGTPGIDASFAGLAPTLEALGAGAVSGLIQGAIEGGELLILVELSHLDGPLTPGMADDCIGFTIHRGTGAPLMGSDGRVMVDQSFGLDPELPSTATVAGRLDGGVLVADGLDITLPVQILDEHLTFDMRGVSFRGEVGADGDLVGHFAGGVPQADIAGQIGAIDDIGELQDLIPPIIAATADLFPDAEGACTELSMGFDYTGRPAFLLE